MRRLALLLVAAACGSTPAVVTSAPVAAPPVGCATVAAGGRLQDVIDGAAEGASLCLEAGLHEGPVRITRRLSLWGPREAVLRGPGAGSVVTFEPGAAGSRLEGLTIDGTGTSFDREGAAVLVRAHDTAVVGVSIEHAVFGVLIERAKRVVLRGARIAGETGPALGLRGDAIRLWETTDSLVEDNEVGGARDLVVWYSSRNRIAGNRVAGGRYGTHLMYSHDCVVEDNRYDGVIVGVFVMYSHGVTIRRNHLVRARGAAGMGIGLKDSGNIVVEENLIGADTVGLYLDSSPVQLTHENRITGNTFLGCDAAVVFLGSARGNTFTANRFTGNRAHVRVEGGGDARAAVFAGNLWDDYAGYDLDDDGTGDLPYELRRLSEDLIAGHPDLRLFEGAPALGILDAAGRLLPLYEPHLVLTDPRPLVR